METKPEEPEHDFLLEERVTSLLLFHTWTVKNFKLKGRVLNYDEDGVLHPVLNTAESVSAKVPADQVDGKEFAIELKCSNGTTHYFNAISEDVREKCIAIFNFSSRTEKWFYPFEETIYKDHATMEVIGIPIKKPIFVPTKMTNNIVEVRNDEKRILLKQKIDSASKNNSRSNSPVNNRSNSPLNRSSPSVVSNSPMPVSRSKSPMKIQTSADSAGIAVAPDSNSSSDYKIGNIDSPGPPHSEN